MQNKLIVIRVDGNSTIGLGHIYRGIALANMLKNEYQIEFLINQNSILTPIEQEGYKIRVIDGDINLLDEPLWIEKTYNKNTIIVLDGYSFNEAFQEKIKTCGFKLIYIDDLITGKQRADIVINHSPSVKSTDYFTEPYTKLALGLNYAILRESFLSTEKRQISASKSIEKVFVSFGGADPDDYTFKVVLELVQLNELVEINVIIGGAYIHTQLSKLNDERVKIHKGISEHEMASLMRSTDVAIVPASTVSIELAFMQVPLLLGYFVENQTGIYKGLVERGLAYPYGNFKEKDFNDLRAEIYNCVNKLELNEIRINSKRNIINLIKNNELEIRNVTAEDIHFVFNLSNEKLVRENSYNSDEILFQDHQKWFANQVKTNHKLFFILHNNNEEIGQVRFNELEEHSIIGISISDKFRGHGYAATGLCLAVDEYFKICNKPVYAYIKKENAASVKVFKKAGFEFFKEDIIDNIDSFVYIRKLK